MKARSLFGIVGPLIFAVGCAQSDAGITTSVKSKLSADDMVKARNIDVDTENRVVTLNGTVESAAEEAQALQIARNTEGVTDVVDNITIAGEQGSAPTTGADPSAPMSGSEPSLADSAMATATDAGITAQVKSSLIADTMVAARKIDVDTKDGVVTLTGTVESNAEKMQAVEVARKIENAKRVQDRITVQAKTQ